MQAPEVGGQLTHVAYARKPGVRSYGRSGGWRTHPHMTGWERHPSGQMIKACRRDLAGDSGGTYAGIAEDRWMPGHTHWPKAPPPGLSRHRTSRAGDRDISAADQRSR